MMILGCWHCLVTFLPSPAIRRKRSKILDQMKALSQGRYVSAYSFALLYLGLGDKNEALRWLEQSYQDRFPEITRIKVEPLLDPLRGDPRFQALAEKVIPLATK